MSSKSAGANPFVDTAKDRLSTFGLDVDTASYTVTRRYLADGNLPPRDDPGRGVRELLRLRRSAAGARGLRPHGRGGAVALHPGPQHRLLRFNLRGREVKAENRKPAVLTFVVDVSGSMDRRTAWAWSSSRSGCCSTSSRPRTTRSASWSTAATPGVLLEPTSDREAVRQAIEQLQSDGATNAEAGSLSATRWRAATSGRTRSTGSSSARTAWPTWAPPVPRRSWRAIGSARRGGGSS